MQTAFGAFVTVYLVKNLRLPQAIGFALTVATMSNLLSQIQAVAVLDNARQATRVFGRKNSHAGELRLTYVVFALPGARE